MTEAPRKPTALIVDDIEDQRKLIRRRIEHLCHVIEAPSSEKAREIMRVVRVDILFTDSNLPSLDGKELVRTLRTDERFLGAVVFVSASAGRPDVHMEMFEAGADTIVEKPFHGDLIRKITQEVATLGEERREHVKKIERERAQARRKERQTKRVRQVLGSILPRRSERLPPDSDTDPSSD